MNLNLCAFQKTAKTVLYLARAQTIENQFVSRELSFTSNFQ